MTRLDSTIHRSEPPSGMNCANAPLRRGRWFFWLFLAIAAFFLLAEHRAHVLGVLPYALLLACPLMHLFMHHGHGGSAQRSPPGKGD